MKVMKRRLIIIALCTLCLPRLQAQGVDEVLQSVAQHNKALQAQRQADAAEKTGIEAENGLEDPSVEYSSFFSKGVSGQAGSELVVSQGFDFPTVYGQRSRAGRERKEAVDLRAEALRRDILLQAKNLCLELIRLNRLQDLLSRRMENADELLALFKDRLEAGDATLIDVNKIKMERMSIQTEVLLNNAAHRTALQSLLVLNGNMPLTFDEREYPAVPDTRDFEALCSEALAADAALMARARVKPPQVVELSQRLTREVSPAFAHISEVAGIVDTTQALAGVKTDAAEPLPSSTEADAATGPKEA